MLSFFTLAFSFSALKLLIIRRMNAAKRPCLPLCKSVAEAVTLSKKDKDNFYVVALYIQRWLARANKEAVAEYAEKKNPRDRSLQTGSVWRAFRQHFGDLPDSQFCSLFTCLVRLTTYCTGDYLGPKLP